MKFTAILLATTLLAQPVLAQGGKPKPIPPQQKVTVTMSQEQWQKMQQQQQQSQVAKGGNAVSDSQSNSNSAGGNSNVTIDQSGINLNSSFAASGSGATIEGGIMGIYLSIPTEATTLRNQLEILIMAGGTTASAIALVAAQDPDIYAALVASGQVVAPAQTPQQTRVIRSQPTPKATGCVQDHIGTDCVPMVKTPNLPQHKGANLAQNPWKVCSYRADGKVNFAPQNGVNRDYALQQCYAYLTR